MDKFKKWLPDLVAVVVFVIISFVYFLPADIEGRILYQHDSSAGRGAGQEALEYYRKALEIRQAILPSDHEDIEQSLKYIQEVKKLMKQ